MLPLNSIAIEGRKFVNGEIVTTGSSIFILKNSTKLWSESVSRRTVCSCVLWRHVSDTLRHVCMTMRGREPHKGTARLGHMSSEEQELQSGQLNPTTIILNFCSKKNLPPLILFSGKVGVLIRNKRLWSGAENSIRMTIKGWRRSAPSGTNRNVLRYLHFPVRKQSDMGGGKEINNGVIMN